jgi:F-type H+-transporting ATPase subunit a
MRATTEGFEIVCSSPIGMTGAFAAAPNQAASVFIFLTFLGLWRQGPVKFFVNLVPHGMPWVLWPFIFVLEYVGSVIRCCVLAIRLFANMLAGHIIILAMLGIIVSYSLIFMALPVLAVVIALYLFEVFVVVLQTYIFTLISAIFMGLLLHPEH